MNEQKFTGKADLYEKFRPSYPNELIDFLYDNARCEAVADIGAGTGKFTRCLLKKPWSVTAVEPNADMRERLSEIAGITVVNAPAEDTGLAEHSFGLVTAAQAFHWFDAERFKNECRRILTEGGKLAVIWFSTNNEEGLGKLQMEVCNKFCLDLIINQGHAGKRSAEEGDRFLRGGYFSELKTADFSGERVFDRESFIGETLSRSYAPKPGQPNYERFTEELGAAFDEFESGGKAAVKTLTTVYLGRL
ncbi:MAG: class I SAM-dependent methyltransferase [Oscillospiraceae bacterium]|nr:class I SAM-dependent methyltransferase [Oscillospiraceae bacterium]